MESATRRRATLPVPGKGLQINAADIAENGLLVPIEVSSSIPNTELMALMIEKNPNTLSAVFSFPAGTEAFFGTRVKMAETSDVYVLARAEGRNYFVRKDIRITLGGCG